MAVFDSLSELVESAEKAKMHLELRYVNQRLRERIFANSILQFAMVADRGPDLSTVARHVGVGGLFVDTSDGA